MAVILIAIGLLFTGIDLYWVSGISYPEFDIGFYVGNQELSPSIKTYTITNILGNQVKIDYLPDVIGCVLILIGVCMLIRYNKQYYYGVFLLFVTAVLSVLLRSCGFINQSSGLVIWVLVCYFFQAAAELFMEYFVLYSTTGITDELVNRSTNTRILFGWWLTVFCRVFITFLDFVGHVRVSRVYQAVLIFATLFYVWNLIRTRKYVGTAPTMKIGDRREREHKEKL